MQGAALRGSGARPDWRMAVVFLLLWVLLQCGWQVARGTALERWIIDGMTVKTSVLLINLLTPRVVARASAASIAAAGGGITIRSGCEGTELLFPVLAALWVCRFSLRARLVGTVVATALVFVLNQLRLLALFYSYRDDPLLFGRLHGLVTPLALVLCLLGFFVLLLRWDNCRTSGEDV